MAIYTDEVVIDKIEILEDGTIQTRELTRVFKDGKFFSSSYTNRKIIEPGQDITKEPQTVKDVAAAVHTQAKVQAYTTAKAARIAADV